MRKKREERRVCCLCQCLTGVSQEGVRQLPDGSFAEEGCIKKKVHRELVQPIQHIIPDISIPAPYNPPEIILKSLAAGLAAQPQYLIQVQEFLRRVMDFSESFLGKSIALSSFK